MESTPTTGPEQRMRADQLEAGRHQVKLGDTWHTVATLREANANAPRVNATWQDLGDHVTGFWADYTLTVREVQA